MVTTIPTTDPDTDPTNDWVIETLEDDTRVKRQLTNAEQALLDAPIDPAVLQAERDELLDQMLLYDRKFKALSLGLKEIWDRLNGVAPAAFPAKTNAELRTWLKGKM